MRWCRRVRWIFSRNPSSIYVRDTAGKYRRLIVGYAVRDDVPRVIIGLDGDEAVLLRPLQVGWLRAALRDLAAAAAVAAASEDQLQPGDELLFTVAER